MKLTAIITAVFLVINLQAQEFNSNNSLLGQEICDIVGSDGIILNKRIQLLFNRTACNNNKINENKTRANDLLFLEFTSDRAPKSRLVPRSFTDNNVTHILEIYGTRKRLIGSFKLSSKEIKINSYAGKIFPFVYTLNISKIPRILIKETESWNLVALNTM